MQQHVVNNSSNMNAYYFVIIFQFYELARQLLKLEIQLRFITFQFNKMLYKENLVF